MFSPDLFFAHGGPVSASDPAAGLMASLLGALRGKSKAGIQVTPELALSLTTWQSCVSLIAESVAQLPLTLYRRVGDSRESVNDHPAARVLRVEPNGWQTPYEFHEQQVMLAAWHGNSYAFLERDEFARPTALIPLDPRKVKVLRGIDGMPYYDLSLANNEKQDPVPKHAINHTRWITTNGYTGIDPVSLHSESLGLALAMRDHAGQVFANGTHLAGVLERPAVVGQQLLDPLGKDAIESIKAKWKAEYAGTSNAMKVALLQDGITFRPLSMTNVEAQLIDARKLSALEIAQIFKVPPHKVGLLERATNNNIECQAIEFVVYCLMPWCKRFEQAYSRDLLLPSERDTLYFEFGLGGLLRGDTQTRYAAYALGRQWGWLSVNDIRRLENLPPIPGGDIYMQPLNMTEVGKTPPPSEKPKGSAMAEIEQILTT